MRRTGLCTGAVLVLLMAAACGDIGAPLPTVPADAIRVPDSQVDTLINASWSGVSQSRRAVIRSAAEWAAFWAEAHGPLTPRPPVPAVDFTRSTVIALAMGGRPSGGYGIRVKEVLESGGGLHVVVEENSPGRRCIVTLVATNPVFAVAVGRAGLDVTFVEERRVHECS